jgi:hypothetical protein
VSPDQVFGIVIVSIAAWTIARIFRGPLGEALARRLGGAEPRAASPDGAEMAELQARVSELEERLDFTERVLLQERQAGELRGGGAT